MKKLLFSLLAVLALAITSHAQQLMTPTSLAANTASNVLAGNFVIDNFVVVNTTTNTGIIYFYDSATTSTNYVQAAYTSYGTSYATNYSVIWTNEASVLVTNTFSGIYTPQISNSAATNTIPVAQILVVPAGSTLNKDVKMHVTRGLTAVPTQALTLVTTYRLP